MNFIALSNRFWRMHREDGFSPSESHLYWCLLNAFNEAGQKSQWPDSVRFTDGALAFLAGLNPKTVDATRKKLIARGLIETESHGQGNRSGVTYRLTSPVTSPKNVDVEDTSVKNGDVVTEVYQQLPRQHTQEHTQKTEKSYIYKEYQTPNSKQQIKIIPLTTFETREQTGTSSISLMSESVSLTVEPPMPPHVAPPPPTDSVDQLQVWQQGLLNSETYLTTIRKNLKLSPEQIAGLIQEFTDEQRATEKHHANQKDYRTHCYNWIRIQAEKKQRHATKPTHISAGPNIPVKPVGTAARNRFNRPIE